MEKKVYVKRYPRDERPHERREDFRGRKDGGRPERDPRDRDQRHRDHRDKGRRDDFHRFKRFERPGFKKVTKMFTDKSEMVAFVNVEGEKGHTIDVYKIEDDLYKVVVVHRPLNRDEIEVEVEEAE